MKLKKFVKNSNLLKVIKKMSPIDGLNILVISWLVFVYIMLIVFLIKQYG
jgi:hypothetical protein